MSASNALMERFGVLGRTAVAALLLGGSMAATLATADNLPLAAAQPPTTPTDSQGYLDLPARCGANQSAVLVGRTQLSAVAICTDGRGHYEYRGMRLSDRAILTLPAAPLANGCFGARTPNVYYTVSERKLLLTAGLRILRDETMLEFKDYRQPTVPPVVPVANQTLSAPSG